MKRRLLRTRRMKRFFARDCSWSRQEPRRRSDARGECTFSHIWRVVVPGYRRNTRFENWARVTYYRGRKHPRKGAGKTMKNDLSCEVVRDLLPSYLDGVASGDERRRSGIWKNVRTAAKRCAG